MQADLMRVYLAEKKKIAEEERQQKKEPGENGIGDVI